MTPKAFAQTVRRHLSSLKAAQECRYLVGDAALYCADTLQLLAQQQQLFVTRVPVTLNEAKQAVATIGAQPLTALGNGYHGRWQHANMPGSRNVGCWCAANKPATASSRHWPKTCSKTVPASSKPSPNCVPDALLVRRMPAELSCFTASLMLLQLDAEVVGEPVYTGRGRPKRGEEPIGHQFQITGLAAPAWLALKRPATRPGCSSWRPMTTAIR